MPRKAAWPPHVSEHRSGQARVTINRVDYYLGAYGSPEASAALAALVKRVEDERSGIVRSAPSNLTVLALGNLYIEAQRKERHLDGKPTEEFKHIRRAVQTLIHQLGDLQASEIHPRHLKEVRTLFLKGYTHPNPEFGERRKQCRKSVNQNITRCRAVFRWAAEENLVPAEVYAGLMVVRGLRVEESGAREMPDVEPVPEADLAKTIPHLTPMISEMVQIQLLSGCRPGEVCRLKIADVDRSGPIWIWKLTRHKTAWRGHKKTIWLGPKAQAILRPFLHRDPAHPCFSPRLAALARRRDWTQWQGNRAPSRQYWVSSYDQAIERACDRAGVTLWSAGQLRHNAATRLEEEFGLDVARILLGHRHLQTTKIYAKDNVEKAAAAARQFG